MKARPILGACLFGLGYALWLGGLVALGAVMAPNVAATLHTTPVLAGGDALKRTLLNGIVGESFRIFNDICVACGVLMLAGGLLEAFRASRAFRRGTTLRAVFVLAALATVARLFILTQAMDRAQAQGLWLAFDSLHHRYEATAMVEFPLLLIAGALTALRDGSVRRD